MYVWFKANISYLDISGVLFEDPLYMEDLSCFLLKKPPAFRDGRRLHRAVAVEPLPEVAASLQRSVQMNGWEHKFQVWAVDGCGRLWTAVGLAKVGDSTEKSRFSQI